MKVDLVHATGNENVRQVLQSLNELQLLGRFWTTVGFHDVPRIAKAVPSVERIASKRVFDAPSGRLKTRLHMEVARNVAEQSGIEPIARLARRGSHLGIDRVQDDLDRHVATQLKRHRPSSVYGYLGQSVRTLEAAKRQGIQTILEMQHVASAEYLELVEREYDADPEWRATLPDQRVLRRDIVGQTAELELADLIVAPSRQVALSASRAHNPAPVHTIPYGCAVPAMGARHQPRRKSDPLKLLFVGRVVSLKGLSYLEQALRDFPRRDVELTIIGGADLSVPGVRRLVERADYRGRQPRSAVLAAIREHDAFVMPSIVEGRSLAVLEAVSLGLPVLVTPGSGTDDLAAAGAGIVVPSRSASGLRDAIEAMHRGAVDLEALSAGAVAVARQSTWALFRSQIGNLVRSTDAP
ncbi:glycosyltransferase family 4 protein [Demequina sediminis]|uniref:glycosyltransferase family 4 protein n=1 Tax=Demequina sediminis TaxID=1930058 RepID=UPI0025741C85|nr:glycosyltransferase [Demequina sediminis]